MDHGRWVSHKEACLFYGVSKNTLRNWAGSGKVVIKRNPSNHRVYFISSIINQTTSISQPKQNFLYCRVSSHKQKDDLDRQCNFLLSRYPDYKIIKDIGSGLNYKRPGLLKILELSNQRQIDTVIISSKDRLCRFGFELIEL
jgi:putative resolvase